MTSAARAWTDRGESSLTDALAARWRPENELVVKAAQGEPFGFDIAASLHALVREAERDESPMPRHEWRRLAIERLDAAKRISLGIKDDRIVRHGAHLRGAPNLVGDGVGGRLSDWLPQMNPRRLGRLHGGGCVCGRCRPLDDPDNLG